MKLNLGCGHNKIAGFTNVDLFPECEPDFQYDLEHLPWPWEDNSASEVVFNHSLEHIGADYRIFLGIMQEVYRICSDRAVVRIAVPHPRHDNFINDPGHVRIVTPELLGLFSKRNNAMCRALGAANSPYADYLDVNFELTKTEITLEPAYLQALQTQKITIEAIRTLARERNNVVSEYRMELVVIKEAAARQLDDKPGLSVP